MVVARTYIHELADWPKFSWDSGAIAPLLSEVRLRQGLLLGRMKSYGFAQMHAGLEVSRCPLVKHRRKMTEVIPADEGNLDIGAPTVMEVKNMRLELHAVRH